MIEDICIEGVRFSIYRDAPSWDGLNAAAIGKFRCTDHQTATAQLEAQAKRLKAEGFEALIGPMDGNTWNSYRLVTQTDGSRPFLLEPTSGPSDLNAFTGAGFEAIANYVSARVKTIDALSPAPVQHESVTLENWDGTSADGFFGEVYDFSREEFAANAFYKPISREAFLGLYRPVVAFLKPELIFFARRADGSLAGFLFGIPDYAQGPKTETVILKTYASKERGVGHLLSDAFHRAALDMGYGTVIHALIHSDNPSLKRSKLHNANVFRRYALMGRKL